MTKREMVNFWETNGMKFFNDVIKENHIKMNSEEELRKMINNWLDVYAPKAERLQGLSAGRPPIFRLF